MDSFFRHIGMALGGILSAVIGVLILFYLFALTGLNTSRVFTFIVALAPIWLPSILFGLTFERWQWFVRAKFRAHQGRTTLRVKLPQEILKSPEAMENVLSQGFYANKPYNLMMAYLDGRHPLVNSFELVSNGGEIQFYVNVPKKKFKNIIEAAFYSQYPGVEIIEEDIDYTAEIKWDNLETWDMMSFHIGKKRDEELPIKTYIDLGLDKMPKEEEKLDAMAPLLEHLAKVKPNERIWIQILMKPQMKTNLGTGDLSKSQEWNVKIEKKIEEMMGRDKPARKTGADEATEEEQGIVRLTPGERGTIESMERQMSKFAYQTIIRAIYLVNVKEGKFDGEMITPLLKAFTQHDMRERNELGVQWRTDFDYPALMDPTGKRRVKYKKSELEDYKARYYYRKDAVNNNDAPKVWSVEELASVYHLPGQVILSPGVVRVESQKQVAPPNLPTGTPIHLQNS